MGERIERDSEWQEAATAASIAAARKVVLGDDAGINKNTPVGRLSDLEWGWIVTSAIFAWIATHAEQATVKGLDVEQTIRFSMLDPNPWDAGMISTVLPKLADVGIDWSKPPADWSRETMITFLSAAHAVLDFNRANLSEAPISVAIDALIEQAEPPEKNAREYRGASAIAHECLRRVQYDWMCAPVPLSQTRDIFARGHFFEELSRQHLIRVGF